VLLAKILFRRKISGNASLAFVEIFKKLFCCIGNAQIGFLLNWLERYNFSSYWNWQAFKGLPVFLSADEMEDLRDL